MWRWALRQRPEPTPPEPDRRRRAGAGPERLTGLTFDRFVREHPRVVVDVWASWCRPCRAFAPIFAESAHRHAEAVAFGRLQADHEPTLVGRLGVRALPTLLFFRDGKIIRRATGAVPADRLERWLEREFPGAL